MNSPCFYQTYFFLLNVHHYVWKLERTLTLIIRNAKGLELMKIVFITYFEHIWLNLVLLTLKFMDFENATLTKIVHVYVIECMTT
jgi:hypothetical protein